ncbi:hypothetical protein NDU88_008967 [Pleurodeles waltl]|uniref:Uncharacterized protein n=1 Tax=Pleurodeles waltl TaxID=8319 RepID=A0AAV7RZN6_PLEWA|nr:hypothetical protein NDU88_008967 [Pleurodeles waltl]
MTLARVSPFRIRILCYLSGQLARKEKLVIFAAFKVLARSGSLLIRGDVRRSRRLWRKHLQQRSRLCAEWGTSSSAELAYRCYRGSKSPLPQELSQVRQGSGCEFVYLLVPVLRHDTEILPSYWL